MWTQDHSTWNDLKVYRYAYRHCFDAEFSASALVGFAAQRNIDLPLSAAEEIIEKQTVRASADMLTRRTESVEPGYSLANTDWCVRLRHMVKDLEARNRHARSVRRAVKH